MRRFAALILGTMAVVSWLSLARPAQAGPLGDDLSRCLAISMSNQDKVVFGQWIMVILDSHPAIAEIAPIDEKTKRSVEEGAAGIFRRLLTKDCAAQAKAAIAGEGADALGKSFNYLGAVATQGIMADPAVQHRAAWIGEHMLDDDAKAKLGLPVTGKSEGDGAGS